MNPNHTTPHYLGGGPNLNLLDNMLMAAGFQVTLASPHLVGTASLGDPITGLLGHLIT